MHDYTAYGLNIHSDLLLPELVEASSQYLATAPRPQGSPHVHITLATIDRRRPPNSPPDAAVWATGDSAFLDYPQSAAYLIRNGDQIVVDVYPDADARLVRLFLLGPALALLLHQRRFLVLHASAVIIAGQAVAFVGDKGMGKSTMAAALHARGHALVADDLVAVSTAGPCPMAYPGFPQLKLFPESAALLDSDPACLPKIHPEFEKRARRAIEGFPTAAVPLHKVFVLTDGDTERVEPLPARQGFMELVRNSYLLSFLQATRSAALHFEQAIALAARVPVARLLRRRSLEALPEVARLVEDDIERAA